ncbi:MAG: Serine protease, subtilase family, partial [Labilithrix sp.]|nr:Serine protease, subtilase family [Labilithrix sp.]
MRLPFLRAASLVGVLALSVSAFRTHEAQAAWPPAQGADMRDQANWPNDYHGPWNYLSYLPERKTNQPLTGADLKLAASGMSIDKAWTYTVGRDDVHIAVIDSGIEWENPDLVERVALNAAELRGDKRPRTKTGEACGGTGDLAGYDCNGDGVFSVGDYRDDARIAPVVAGETCFTDGARTVAGPERIKGDVNRNCILDPGDLITLFSDGVDDDANGYTDDIAGWDFFKNDNDPYDDTRYGHGTGEAEDSSAQANNGSGDPGVCPGCRFIPLRVGNSFITDSNDFGKAVIYGADQGVKVVQEALGTINSTAFARAAIDYAYAKGAIVMASMADENSRHHNAPATSNHTLTVHSIRYDNDVETATSYLTFDTCSNYGGHLALSISATSCSSEATGRSSGIAGLAFSMAKKVGLDLSAEEVMQLFKTYADDVDVAESRGPESAYFFSHPGFDQRFGYGRANAARMMQAIQDGQIPPEVDVVSPTWFAPLDQKSGLVSIMGRVAATRARAYDVRVQWAPGVEPDESAYQDLAPPLLNVPGATMTGGATPLAQLDLRAVNTKHERDPDSPLGENDRTISVRVQAVAHYDSGDVRGEARRVVSVTNDKNPDLVDPDLLPGFPLALGASVEASPKLADIDGDGVRDIVAPDSSGRIHVYTLRSGMPAELAGFPYRTRRIDGLVADGSDPAVPSYLSAPAYKAGSQPNGGGVDPDLAREALVSAPAVADLDGDGKLDIVMATWAGTLYAIDGKGQDLPGWPKRLPLVPSCSLDPTKPATGPCMDVTHDFARGTYGAPVVIDMDRDGKPEIVIGAFDGNIHVFRADGTALPGFPVALVGTGNPTSGPSRIMATPTVADLNGDGIPEIISGSNEQVGLGGGGGQVFAVDGRGNAAPGGPYLPNWPVTVTSLKLFPVVAEGIVASQAVADFDGDGRSDVLVQGNGAPPLVVKADPGVQTGRDDPPNRLPPRQATTGELDGFDSTSIFGEQAKAQPDVFFPLFSQPAIGDMDQDGVPDVIMSGGSLSLASSLTGGGRRANPGQHLLAFWSGKTGKMLPGMPVVLEDYTFLVNQTIADVSGDDYPEAIVGTGGYFLHATDGCGREAPGFPKFTNGWIASATAVGDIDGDAARSLEVVTGTRDGYLFAWRTKGSATGHVEWESFHHDNANTGNVATKLDQGGAPRAATVLDCSVPAAPVTERFDAGGCGCTTAGQRGGAEG